MGDSERATADMRLLGACGFQRSAAGKAAEFEKHAVCASSPCSRSTTVRDRGSLKTAAARSKGAPCLLTFAPLEPPGGRGNREKIGKGASRKMDKMSLSPEGLVRAERPKPEFPRKRRSDLRSDAPPSAR